MRPPRLHVRGGAWFLVGELERLLDGQVQRTHDDSVGHARTQHDGEHDEEGGVDGAEGIDDDDGVDETGERRGNEGAEDGHDRLGRLRR